MLMTTTVARVAVDREQARTHLARKSSVITHGASGTTSSTHCTYIRTSMLMQCVREGNAVQRRL